MELNKDVLPQAEGKSQEEILARLADNLEKQNRFARWQFYFALARTGLIAVICVVALSFVARVAPMVEEIAGKANTVITAVQEVDFVTMTQSVTQLAVTGSDGVEQALADLDVALADVSRAIGTVEKIDIEKLNGGIQSLNDVLEPLSKFFAKFTK